MEQNRPRENKEVFGREKGWVDQLILLNFWKIACGALRRSEELTRSTKIAKIKATTSVSTKIETKEGNIIDRWMFNCE